MNIEDYRQYCLAKTGVTESTPFPKLPDILVFKVKGKMFTATDLSTFESFSIKCQPETIDSLRARYRALKEPSYFSKKHWSLVEMDGTIPDPLLFKWLDTSYDLVVLNLSKKAQQDLANNA